VLKNTKVSTTFQIELHLVIHKGFLKKPARIPHPLVGGDELQ
jgi:hypothetical protein